MGEAYRHPTQLYESLFNLGLYVALVAFFLRARRRGTVFALYLVAYSAGRFALEFLRGDERAQWFGLTVAQIISVLLLLLGCVLFVLLPRTRSESHADPARSS